MIEYLPLISVFVVAIFGYLGVRASSRAAVHIADNKANKDTVDVLRNEVLALREELKKCKQDMQDKMDENIILMKKLISQK